jgi:hypothetical protein
MLFETMALTQAETVAARRSTTPWICMVVMDWRILDDVVLGVVHERELSRMRHWTD